MAKVAWHWRHHRGMNVTCWAYFPPGIIKNYHPLYITEWDQHKPKPLGMGL